MKKIPILIFMVSIIVSSCSKESTQVVKKCDFIGKWCTPNPTTITCLLGVQLEFRENGDLLLQSSKGQTWKSDDCKTIIVTNTGTGLKAAEYKVISVTSTTLLIDIGVGETEYTKAP
jgi:hypothetical protein